jgi:hypothetical protein
LHEFDSKIAISKDLKELQELIMDTNKKIQMRFKREHVYNLEKYEEQLYKEVVFDLRGDHEVDGEIN